MSLVPSDDPTLGEPYSGVAEGTATDVRRWKSPRSWAFWEKCPAVESGRRGERGEPFSLDLGRKRGKSVRRGG